MMSNQIAILLSKNGLAPLDDKAGWTHRFEIKSESSSRIYVVAKRISDGEWGCSCPGWRTRRHCKHLSAMAHIRSQIDSLDGIGQHQPTIVTVSEDTANAVSTTVRRPRSVEAEEKHKERVRRSFTDEAYKHYDTSNGFGNVKDWERMAEGVFEHLKTNSGDEFILAKDMNGHGLNVDLKKIGLEQHPNTFADLKAAARKMFLKTHPDHGGTPEMFRDVHAAYEKLALKLFRQKV
ncbi:MAG: hypothetical protein WC284_17640 [Candidimonas sp.]